MGSNAWPDDTVLTDGLVVLRRWRDDDAPAVMRACQDPEIARWIPPIPIPYSIEDARAFIASTSDLWHEAGGRAFAIVDIDDRLLGSVALHGPAGHAAEIGYWLTRDARGRGHATRAVRLLSSRAFEVEPALIRLTLHTLVGNDASGRVAERAGFTREGVLRAYELVRGEPTDIVIYSVVRSDLGRGAAPARAAR